MFSLLCATPLSSVREAGASPPRRTSLMGGEKRFSYLH